MRCSRVSRLPAVRGQVRRPSCRTSPSRTATSRCCARSKWSASRCPRPVCRRAALTRADREFQRPLGQMHASRSAERTLPREHRRRRATTGPCRLPSLHGALRRAARQILAQHRGAVAADHGLVDCPRYGVTIDDPLFTAPKTAATTPASSCRRGSNCPRRRTRSPAAAMPSPASRARRRDRRGLGRVRGGMQRARPHLGRAALAVRALSARRAVRSQDRRVRLRALHPRGS